MTMIHFKISGIMFVSGTVLSILTSRNSELILGVSNMILETGERIMICDFVSLFLAILILFIFCVIIPSITFDIRVCLE